MNPQQHLRQAADDRDVPLTTDLPGLLDRAKARHTRRRRARAAGGVAGVVALTAGALAAVPLLTGTDESAPAPPPAASTRASEPPQGSALTENEILQRCAPQLGKYLDYPMYADTRRTLAHDRDYRAGDLVLLRDRAAGSRSGSNPVLCLIPAAGREQDGVPFSRLSPHPGSTDADLLELCAETFEPERSLGGPWVDLREGAVLARDGDADVTVALVGVGEQRFQCSLSSPTWDAGLSDVHSAARGPIYLDGGTTGASNKSLVDQEAAYYYAAGRTTARAASVELRFPDGTTASRPVGPDGAYAVLVRRPGAGGLQPVTVRTLDERGQVLRVTAT